MPNFSEMTPSRFMKKEHVEDQALVLTIKDYVFQNVAKEEDPIDEKWVLHFEEFDKPLVLNKTNIGRLARHLGVKTSEATIGKQIEVYFDPDVEFGGKVMGGIRLRAPQ